MAEVAVESRSLVAQLRNLDACGNSLEWVDDYADPQIAYDRCERGDWLAWLHGRMINPDSVPARRKLVRCLWECFDYLAPPFTDSVQLEQYDLVLKRCRRWSDGDEADDCQPGELLYGIDRFTSPKLYCACDLVLVIKSCSSLNIAVRANCMVAEIARIGTETASDRREVLEKCARIVRNHYPFPPTETPGRD